MPESYKGFTVPSYADTADGPAAFKSVVDSVLAQLPRGLVGYAESTGTVTVGQTIATVLSVTATLESGRYYIAMFNGFFRGAAATGFEAWFRFDNSTSIGSAALDATAIDLPVTASSRRFTATSGSHTISLQHRHVSGGGAGNYYTGGGGGNMNLAVLDVGPTS